MERLRLDFNNRDERGWLRIGPAAQARNAVLRDGRIAAGDRLQIVDDEGNSCLGTLRRDPVQPADQQWFVELDWSTWLDAEAETAPKLADQTSSAAAGT